MEAAKQLFAEERYAQCVDRCEKEVKFATTSDQKLPFHLLASQSALKAENFERAKFHAEVCVKLDNARIVTWQTLYDALMAQPVETKDAKRIAQVLSTQGKIAARNGNSERASGFTRRAAEQYEKVGELVLASEHWEEAYQLLPSPELLFGLASCYELLNDTLQADKCWWQLCESDLFLYDAALRLLSRPCHVVLEAKRAGQTEQVKSQEKGAWGEFERRVERMGKFASSPKVEQLLFACGQRIAPSTEDDGKVRFAMELVGSKEEIDLAIQARAWFLLAKMALENGDPVAGWQATLLAEEMEQRVYAKYSANAAARVIGTEFIIRPFSGNEVLSLVCQRTLETMQTKGCCALAYFPGGGGIRAGIRLAERAFGGGSGKEELELCELLGTLMRASYPFVAEAEFGQSKLAGLFRALDWQGLGSVTGSWFDRRMAYLLRSACRALLFELKHEQILNDGEPCPISPFPPVRQLLPKDQTKEDETLGELFCDVWMQRLTFSQQQIEFNPQTSLHLLQRDDNLPLVCELLGKHYMGLDSPEWFHAIPQVQPDRKRVRDPAKAVKYLAMGVQLDGLGLGCIAPLANAFHAAQQEEKARVLYESVTQHATQRGGELLMEWTFVRLGQQQLRYNQPVLASASFQRAMANRKAQGNLAALCGLGEADAKMGRLGAAAQNLERALLLAPNNAAIQFKLAQLLATVGETVKAIALFREIATDTPPLLPVKQELAECELEHARYLLARGCVAEAKGFLQQAHDNFAQTKGYKGLGDVCGELREWELAKTWYLKACQASPWDALARYDLARVLIQLQVRPAQVVCCEASVVLDPADAQSWNLLGMSRHSDDVYVAQHCFVRSLQLAPDTFASPWLNLGWTLMEKKPALAKRAFSQAQTIDPDSCQAWLGHFKCASLSKDTPTAATAALECAVDVVKYNALDESASTALLLLGEVLLSSLSSHGEGKDDESKQLLLMDVSARAVQLARTSDHVARAWALQGQVHYSCEALLKAKFDRDTDNAARVALNLAVLQSGAHLEPVAEADLDYWHALGRLHMRNGSVVEALAAFERALEFDSSSLVLRLDWLDAIVASPDHDVEFAQQVASAWILQVKDGDELLLRFVQLGNGRFASMLSPQQRLGLNPLSRIYNEPWKVANWFKAGGNGGAAAASRAVLVLARQNPGNYNSMVFEAGKQLLGDDSKSPLTGYWSGGAMPLKLQHLAPWEKIF
ncbi:hypothetical protein BASA81_010557 [Batrachochytrium salamandrivorans]|nr:hypothetical protein BASA81_010557 [Batrachochytrium salamandrivorans]